MANLQLDIAQMYRLGYLYCCIGERGIKLRDSGFSDILLLEI